VTKPYGFEHLQFAVVGSQGDVVSVHQHPDAATRFIATSYRDDLSVVYLENGIAER
jgi:hypothetical protein